MSGVVQADRPRVGLIIPPANNVVPPECETLYGDAIEFAARGAALKSLDIAGYTDAETRIAGLAEELRDWGAAAIVLMGTSMTFYRGRAHTREMEEMASAASGLPTTSLSSSVITALASLDAQRIVLGTAYVDEVNQALVSFLAEHGIETTGLSAMDIRDVREVHEVTSRQVLDTGLRAFEKDPDADAILISCGALHTLEITAALEEETGKTVISSAVAGAGGAAAMAGIDTRRSGYGRWLQAVPFESSVAHHRI
mgnify:CR=1 FL=1